MTEDKQKLLLEYLISSPDTYAMCAAIIKPGYFDPGLRNAVTFIQQYYDSYSKTPDATQVHAESGIQLKEQTISPDRVLYCADEIEQFCKDQAIQNAVLQSATKVNDGDTGSIEKIIKDALNVSLHKDLGLDYFTNVKDRLERLKNADRMIPTGWLALDELLGGGINRGEMLLWSANSGGGKSVTMANLGLNFVERGYNVLYISLELSTDLIAKRFDSMITNINQTEILARSDEVAINVEKHASDYGKLKIIQMPPGTTANDIRAYINELYLVEGWTPDLLVHDYIDLGAPNEKVGGDNVFEKDKLTTEQFRALLSEFDMCGTTASQQNRSAVDQIELNHSHIAGGLSKINTTDNYISIIMTEAMRAMGEMVWVALKTRSSDGVGKRISVNWVGNSLRITNRDPEAESFIPQHLKTPAGQASDEKTVDVRSDSHAPASPPDSDDLSAFIKRQTR
jgi:replicative DNA helicase